MTLNLKTILIAAIVVTVVGSGAYLLGIAQRGSQAPPPAPAAAPDGPMGMHDLFGANSAGGINQPEGRFATFWKEIDFTFNGTAFHTVFVTESEADENGKPIECHACAPTLDAITYRKTDTGWDVVSKQRQITEYWGQWGKPSDPSQASVTALGEFPALMQQEIASGQGETEKSTQILVFKNKWADAGVLRVGGDNSGNCGVESLPKCWSWTGRIEVQKATLDQLPHLIVKRTGTTWTNGNAVIPVNDQEYEIAGNTYVEMLRITEGLVAFPRDEGFERIQTLARGMGGELKCQEFEGSYACILNNNQAIANKVFGGTLVNCIGEIAFYFDLGSRRLDQLACDISSDVAADIEKRMTAKYGESAPKSRSFMNMQADTHEWVVGVNHVDLTYFTGTNIKGEPLNKSHLSISKNSGISDAGK